MANIIPMAGRGSRFTSEGYLLPKPLIPVSGKPMIIQVIRSLPKSDKWIFLVRQEHISDYAIDKIIKSEITSAIIVPISEDTEGQASTCVLAMPHLSPEEEMFVAACDNSFLFDKDKFIKLAKDPRVDSVIWTFTRSRLLIENPQAWGWVQLDNDGVTIRNMPVKKPVSDDPFNDHAVVATFYFKKARQFQTAYEMMKTENYRINNEFYVDSMPIFYNKLNLRSVIFDVDLYVGWGKPSDLHQYELKEYLCEQNIFPTGDKEFKLWQKFFKQKLIN